MELPPLIAAEFAIKQQNVALSLIKKQAQINQQIANILTDSVSSIRGNTVNISA